MHLITSIHRALAKEWVAVAAVTLVAALLRIVAIDRLPPGLYHDEAYNGLDALAVLEGYRPIFFPANNGREPLFIYLLAASVRLLGPTPGALRLVAAILGTLTVPAAYVMAKELFGRRIGILSAWLAAVTVWPLNLSRVALRAVSMPLFVGLSIALLWRGLRRRHVGWLVAGGLAYGLLFYTYLAARFTPIALAAFLLYLVLVHREDIWWQGWLIFAAAALLVATPLGLHLASDWEEMSSRSAQVAIWNPAINRGDPWGMLAHNIVSTVGGFFWRGDFIPRHNVPLRPVFDPLTALFFALGIFTALRNVHKPAHAFSLIWVCVMLAPTILAEDAPHMLRGCGVLPVLFVFPALGFEAALQVFRQHNIASLSKVLVAAVLLYGSVEGPLAYFRHLNSEAAYYNYETGASELAIEVNRFLGVGWQGEGISTPRVPSDAPAGAERLVYVAPRFLDSFASVRYLCSPALSQGLASSDAKPEAFAGASEVMLVVWPFEDYSAALEMLPPNRLIIAEEGAQERGDLEKESRLLYVTIEAREPDRVPHNVERRWAQGIELLGYEATTIGSGGTAVDLFWRANQPLPEAYTVFVHLLEDGILASQHDGPAAMGYYGTERWRPGDLVRDRHILSVPLSELEGAGRALEVGLYRRETMERVPMLDNLGNPTEVTALVLP